MAEQQRRGVGLGSTQRPVGWAVLCCLVAVEIRVVDGRVGPGDPHAPGEWEVQRVEWRDEI